MHPQRANIGQATSIRFQLAYEQERLGVPFLIPTITCHFSLILIWLAQKLLVGIEPPYVTAAT